MDWAKTVPAVVASVLALATFLPSMGNDFVYDDVRIVLQQEELHSLDDVRAILTAPWWSDALYRPLTKLSLAVDWVVSGGRAWYFHLVNTLLHVAVVIVVFIIARRWLDRWLAMATAAIFAVHPVHVEAVASVVGRAEVLATLFTGLAVVLYRWDGVLARYHDTSWRRYASSLGTLGMLFLAFASKETAFVAPGLLLLVDWMESRSSRATFEEGFRNHWILWLGCVALALEWLWLRALILGDYAGDFPGPGLEGLGIIGRAVVMAPLVLQYVRLFVFPAHLSADYSPDFVPAIPAWTWETTAGMAVLVGIVAVAVGIRERVPAVTFGLAWVGACFLVVGNVLVPTGVLLAERTLYLPSVGVALVGGAAAGALHSTAPRLTSPILALLLGLGLVRSAHRIPVFRDDQTFYPQLIVDAPGSFRAKWVSGNLAYMEGDRVRGEALLREALNTHPLFPNVWQDLGRHLQQDGRWSEAARAFSIAYRLDTTRVYDAANAVSNFLRATEMDSARYYAEHASRVNAYHPRVKGALAELAAARGDRMRAMTLHRQAVWLQPNEPQLWNRLARAALAAGFCPVVRDAINELQELAPDRPDLPELQASARSNGCGTH